MEGLQLFSSSQLKEIEERNEKFETSSSSSSSSSEKSKDSTADRKKSKKKKQKKKKKRSHEDDYEKDEKRKKKHRRSRHSSSSSSEEDEKRHRKHKHQEKSTTERKKKNDDSIDPRKEEERNEKVERNRVLRQSAGLDWMTAPGPMLTGTTVSDITQKEPQTMAASGSSSNFSSLNEQSLEFDSTKKTNKTDQPNIRDPFNMKNPSFPKQMILALGEHSFLVLPPSTTQLAALYSWIIPISSIGSIRDLDRPVYLEVEKFKRSILAMHSNLNLYTVFMETYLDPRRITKIECFGIQPTQGANLPMMFKKEILECGEEWSENPKLFNLEGKRLREGFPSNQPYFFVEIFNEKIDSLARYGHLIEGKFPHNFGLDVLRGSYGDGSLPEKQNDRDRLALYLSSYKNFDWTAELEGGEYQT